MTSAMDLRTLAVIVFKFRRRAGLVFLLAVGLAVAASVLMPMRYGATASVLVKIGRELIYRPEIGAAAAPLENIDKDQVVASNIAIMQSPSLKEEVIGTIGLERLYPDIAEAERGGEIGWLKSAIHDVKDMLGMPHASAMRQATLRFDRDLSIELVKKTGIIAVSFGHSDPQVAADVANTVVSLFQQRVGQIFDNPNLQFAENRVNEMRASLEAAEGKLNAYRLSHNVYALDDQVGLLLRQKNDLDTKLQGTTSQIVQLQGLTAAISAQSAVTPRTVPLYTETERHRAVDDMTSQLLALRLQEQQLSTRFGNGYPLLAEVRNQIKVAQTALASQSGDGGSHTRTGVNEVRTALDQSLMQNQAQLQSLLGTRDTLRGQMTAVDAAVAELTRTQPELAQLQRDVELRAAAVKTSYDKLVEARTVEGLNHEKPASFSLYEAARPADLADPVRPLPMLYMLVGIVVGLLGAVVTTFLSYRMCAGFLTPKQAALRLDRPVLAVIDYNRRLGSWRRPAGADQLDGMVGGLVGGRSRALSA